MVAERSIRDELDVQRVLVEYAWARDNKDWRLLRSVFTADAQLDYSSTRGPAGGRDEVVGWLDRAAGQAMFYTSVRVPGLDEMPVTGGYYDLAFRREPDGWKILREPSDRLTDSTAANAPVRSLDSVLERVADQLRLVVQLQLGQGVADMVLHRAGGHGETGGDLRVGQALGDQP